MGNSWLIALHSELGQILTLIGTFLKDTDDVIKKAVPSLPECFVGFAKSSPTQSAIFLFWEELCWPRLRLCSVHPFLTAIQVLY